MINTKAMELGTKRSCIRELFEYGLKRAREVGKENVYDFSLGNPSVPAPEGVNRTLVYKLDNCESTSLHGYTPASGTPEARKAIAKDLKERFGFPVRAENVFITSGAAPAMTAVLSALFVPDGEAVIIAPFFPEYKVFVENSGLKFVVVDADTEHFQIRFDLLEKLLNKNTQTVVVNSPNNPSGTVYSKETLEQLSSLLTRKSREFGHPIYLISDEPYRELVYDGIQLPFVPSIYPDTVICYSYSKSLSLPGERIGYVLVPDSCTDADKLFPAVAGAARAMGHVCAPSLMQKMVADCAVLRPDIESYDRNRKLLYNSLTSYGYKCARPQGAFYLFVKAPGGDAQAFSDYAKTFDLLIVPGADFGCPDFFRISTCVSYEMIQKSLPIFEKIIKSF